MKKITVTEIRRWIEQCLGAKSLEEKSDEDLLGGAIVTGVIGCCLLLVWIALNELGGSAVQQMAFAFSGGVLILLSVFIADVLVNRPNSICVRAED